MSNSFIITMNQWSIMQWLDVTLIALGIVTIVTHFSGAKRPFWLRATIIGITMLIAGRYFAWRTFDTLVLNQEWYITAISVFTLVAELYLLSVNTISSWLLFLMQTNRSPEADKHQLTVDNGTFNPAVDVFIPTVNEPLNVLRRTITGCLNMTYANKLIWVLDDGRRPEVARLAEELGVGYFTRNDNSHFKAGNVNNALWQTGNPYICFFDADFVPVPSFLNRVIGFFQKEKVAIVQTPQSFYNPDLVEMNLGLQNSLTNEQDLFFRGLQPGRDHFNAVICCGTSFVARRDLLEGLGGMPTETITEDLMTSTYLQAEGYEVVYLNEALSFGEAPNRSVDHLKQRIRWARGILQTLFTPVNPLTSKGLGLFQRYFHLIGCLYWTTFPARLYLMLMPMGYMLLTVNTMNATVEHMVSYFLPYYLCSMMVFSWFNRGRRSPFWSEVYEFIPAFALIPNVILSFVDPFGLGFKVTPKGVTSNKIQPNWDVIIPAMSLIAIHAIGYVRILLDWQWEAANAAVFLNLAWAGYAVLVFWMVCLACVDVPQKRENLRLPQAWEGLLQVGQLRLTLNSVDISEGGIRFALTPEQAKLMTPLLSQSVVTQVSVPALGIISHSVAVTLHSQQKQATVLCQWGVLSQAVYKSWLKGVITRLADEWEGQKVPEWRFVWHFIKSPFRMYSLASQ
jgi:cellulose synthase (UDP-forming)